METQQYVSKSTFDDVWKQLQDLKAAQTGSIVVLSFEETRIADTLMAHIRNLEAQVETLKAIIENGRE